MALDQATKQQLIETYRIHETDTGSPGGTDRYFDLQNQLLE